MGEANFKIGSFEFQPTQTFNGINRKLEKCWQSHSGSWTACYSYTTNETWIKARRLNLNSARQRCDSPNFAQSMLSHMCRASRWHNQGAHQAGNEECGYICECSYIGAPAASNRLVHRIFTAITKVVGRPHGNNSYMDAWNCQNRSVVLTVGYAETHAFPFHPKNSHLCSIHSKLVSSGSIWVRVFAKSTHSTQRNS